MISKSRRFVPRLEALDDRSLPSVSYFLNGTTLVITGDAGANTITITDDGTPAGLTVVGDGVPFPAVGDAPVVISAVVVDSDAGVDTIVYDLVGPQSAGRLLSFDLGRGKDVFTANLNGQSITGNLGIVVNGDGGGDSMVLNAHGVTLEGAGLSVEFFGQGGKDSFAFNHDPGFDTLPGVNLVMNQRQ